MNSYEMRLCYKTNDFNWTIRWLKKLNSHKICLFIASEWTIDQVSYYIYQLNDSYFSSYVETFKNQVSTKLWI